MTDLVGVFVVWLVLGNVGPLRIEEYPGTLEGNVLCERSAAQWRLAGFEAGCEGEL